MATGLPRLLQPQEVQRWLGISAKTLRRYLTADETFPRPIQVRTGRAVRLRFVESELAAWFRRQQVVELHRAHSGRKCPDLAVDAGERPAHDGDSTTSSESQ